MHKVILSIAEPVIESSLPTSEGSVDVYETGEETVFVNNVLVDEQTLQRNNNIRLNETRRGLAKRNSQLENSWNRIVENDRGWEEFSEISKAVEDGHSSVVLELTTNQIRRVAGTSSIIVGIDLHNEGQDDIAGAMNETKIDPHAISNNGRRGEGIGIYMTESGCPNANFIGNYTRLAGSRTNHSENVSGILRAASPASHIYCRGGAVLPTNGDLNNNNPDIFLVNRSHSSGYTTDYNTVDRDWDNFVYNNQISVFKSAGNQGNGNAIGHPGNGFNIVTVGNYNDATDLIWGTSSSADPDTDNQKPELSAPGVQITAGGRTMTGTSQSTPHAAAFMADMMSSKTWLRLRPHLAKAFVMAGSRHSIGGGEDAVGVGGLDFHDAFWSNKNYWWEGNNASFINFARNDGENNTSIEKRIWLNSSSINVRVVLAWLNRGDFLFSRRTAGFPIGLDFDMQIFDPNGNLVGTSASFDDPFEMIEFDPQISGHYKIRITRFRNRDTAANIRIGLSINFSNKPKCVDSDGDGWGWDGTQSCRV